MNLLFGHKNKFAGFSFIELLIAIALVNLVVVGSMVLIETSSKNSRQHNEISWRNIENDELTKMLSEPKYFGAIANYTANSALKKCMSEDTHLCNKSTEYPLVPIDLKTGSPLNSISGASNNLLFNFVTFKIHCPGNLAECDKAEYFSVKIKTTVTLAGSQQKTVEKVTLVKPEVEKVSILIPDANISEGRPLNAILLVDSSGSLLAEKDKIKSSLDALLLKLSSMNVNLAILPLDGFKTVEYNFLWDTIDPTKKIPVNPSDLAPLSYYYREEKYSLNLGYQYKVGDAITFPAYRKIQFLTTDSAVDKTSKLNAANALIDYLFNSNYEFRKDVPICALLHYFENGDSQFTSDPMTPTFVMLITNENDESYLASSASDIPTSGSYYDAYNFSYKYCLKELNRRVQKGDLQSNYYGKESTYLVNFTARMLKDGTPVMQNITTHINAVYSPTITFESSCLGASGLYEETIKFLNTDINYKGKYISDLVINTCTYKNSSFFQLEESKTSGLCPINENDYRLKWPSYIHNSCWENIMNAIGAVSGTAMNAGIHSIVPLSPANTLAHSTHSVRTALIDNITSKITNSNFYFVPVIHSPMDGCTLTSGAQYGTEYIDLASQLNMQNNVTPICSTSFTSKINELDAFLDRVGLNDFTIPIDLASKVTGVEVKRGTSTIYPISGVDYKITDNILIFKTGYIQPGDIIRTFYQ